MNKKKSVLTVVIATGGILFLGLMGTGCRSNRDASGQDLSQPASQPAGAYGNRQQSGGGGAGGGGGTGGGGAGTRTPPGPAGGR